MSIWNWAWLRSPRRRTPCRSKRFITHKALDAVIDKDAPKSSPVQPTEANLLAGVEHYRQNCAVCHGLPGQPKTDIAKGEFPKPPQLFEGKGVTDDPAGETFWKIKNGIRLTGMPGFEGSLTDQQMWQISVLLASEKLPGRIVEELKRPPQGSSVNMK